MYIPSCFAEKDKTKLYDFLEHHSFATLVSGGETEPLASHLPLLVDRTEGRLIGHMARANPQWRQAADQKVLVIFHGPHAYISPSWCESAHVVPTWNYVAVHVYGLLRLEEDQERVLEIVKQYIAAYEASMPQPWPAQGDDPEFLKSLLGDIVGFTIDIERMEGKWKLSQNHDQQRRTKVIQSLRSAGGENRNQIADLMEKTLEG